MIHRRKGRKLKRTASHRAATLANMCNSLIMHKKIKTTLAKAKEMRRFVEPLITKSKKAFTIKSDKPEANIHLRREANKFLQDKAAIKMLFDEIAPKVMERNGGYTRVLKMGRRQGDAAEMALIELVDFNIEQAPVPSGKTETEAKDTKETKDKSETTAKPKKSKKTTTKSKAKTTTTRKKKKRSS